MGVLVKMPFFSKSAVVQLKVPQLDDLETKDDSIKGDNENEEEDAGIVDEKKNDVQEENEKENTGKNESGNGVRRSARKKIQRITIEADDIGDCDTDNDPDYEEQRN